VGAKSRTQQWPVPWAGHWSRALENGANPARSRSAYKQHTKIGPKTADHGGSLPTMSERFAQTPNSDRPARLRDENSCTRSVFDEICWPGRSCRRSHQLSPAWTRVSGGAAPLISRRSCRSRRTPTRWPVPLSRRSRRVASSPLLKNVDETTAGVGNGVARSSHDLSRRDLMSVDLRTSVVVRT
jgi:hypothetical protein